MAADLEHPLSMRARHGHGFELLDFLAWLPVAAAIALKAAASIYLTISLPLAFSRIRIMSSSARVDRLVTLAERQPLSCSLHDPSTIPCGRSAAAWKTPAS